MSRANALEVALGLECIFEVDGKLRFGALTLDEAQASNVVLTPYGRKREGEYMCMRSTTDDIADLPVVKTILERLPNTQIALRNGRQALAFQKGDEVFLKMLVNEG